MRRSAWIVAAAGAALTLALARPLIAAQDTPKPAEVAALFDDINDIDKLRALAPLKLDAHQIDRFLLVIKSARDDYNKKLTATAVPPIRSIAAEIKETRRKALTGGPIPADFDQKVKDMEKEFIKQRKQQDDATLLAVARVARDILTSEQVNQAIALTKKLTMVDGKPTLQDSPDALWFNLWVRETFINYPRAIPLLEDMKAATTGATSTGK